MNVRCNLGFLKHLIRDTFRQAVASGIFWMMLVVTAICVVFCLSVDVSGDVALHSEASRCSSCRHPRTTPLSPRLVRVKKFGFPSKPILRWRDARESRRSAAA